MVDPEHPEILDPRLQNPDQYFLERYGDVLVSYGDQPLPLKTALQFENLARTPQDIANDPKARRANVFIDMLRNAGALAAEDDITYPVGP